MAGRILEPLSPQGRVCCLTRLRTDCAWLKTSFNSVSSIRFFLYRPAFIAWCCCSMSAAIFLSSFLPDHILTFRLTNMAFSLRFFMLNDLSVNDLGNCRFE